MTGVPAININLEEVKQEIGSIKQETGAIKETLAQHGEQLVDIKVDLLAGNIPLTVSLFVVERPGDRPEEHFRGHRRDEVPAGQHSVHGQQII